MLCVSFNCDLKNEKLCCFQNVKIVSLPVHSKSNQKAMMAFIIFSQWLEGINEKMKREERKIIFVYYERSLPNMQLTSMSLQFLRPKCSSIIQPLNQGRQLIKGNFETIKIFHCIAIKLFREIYEHMLEMLCKSKSSKRMW